jgi:hypothetical protein
MREFVGFGIRINVTSLKVELMHLGIVKRKRRPGTVWTADGDGLGGSG